MALTERVYIGKKPPTPNLAWWYLTARAKKILYEERLKGRFGGMVGKAPYRYVQERGNQAANVEALFYIKKAIERWETRSNAKINQFIRGY